MPESLRFEVHKSNLMTADAVKIDPQSRAIICEVQRATGLPARTIVSRMIKYCADKWEVVEL